MASARRSKNISASARTARAIRSSALFYRSGESKLTLACQLRKPAFEGGHWYAVIVDQHGQQVPEGYLGTIDSDNEATRASDGTDHYSIRGFLEYARGLQK